MEFHIRAEQAGDSGRIAEIIKAVFHKHPHNNHTEHILGEPSYYRRLGFVGAPACKRILWFCLLSIPGYLGWAPFIRYSPVRADFAGDSKVGNRITM